MTDLERIALAIYNAENWLPDETTPIKRAQRMARVAVEAMREPSAAAIKLGAEAGEMYGNTDAEATWKVMIDAILNEKP